MSMEYRRLGNSGIRVSVLSFGSWVTFGPQLDIGLAAASMSAAREAGVNFFDNAEVYSGGDSEAIMGKALSELAWPRYSYVISTKFFWGIHKDVNMSNTLNRKYLMQAIDGSLERLGLDFVDIAYCHRPDPDTPIEETVWAMSDMIDRGKALYWGTSEWPANQIVHAHEVATREHLRHPVVEQPQYNLLWRDRVEQEYISLYDRFGMGLTIWSPLASGLLTGKYRDGVPEGSRASLPGYEWLRDLLVNPKSNARVQKFLPIAANLGCTPAQLAIAWCAHNPHVSTVITGASRPEQVTENMGALEVLPLLNEETIARIEAALA